MVNAIRIHEHGGADALRWEAVEIGDPGPGEIRVRHTAVGLNFIDIYQRNGLYKLPDLPITLGMEGAGVVVATGKGVSDLAEGNRIAYANPIGSYCEERLMPAERAVKLPDSIDDRTGAAMMLQGMTARYLLRETYEVTPETTLLIHAAAGGVGQIVCQWARNLGATVIGTAGSHEKCALATSAGAHHAINYNTESFEDRVREITGGKGVDVVYDSIGQATCEGSLNCLRPRGLFVTYGNASGPITGFDLGTLGAKGSLYVTRPTLFTYIASRDQLLANAAELFEMVGSGKVKIAIGQTYPLSETAQAHRDLEARKTTGSTVLLP